MKYENGTIYFSELDQRLTDVAERVSFDDHFFEDALDAFDSVCNARLDNQDIIASYEYDDAEYGLSRFDRRQLRLVRKEYSHVDGLWRKLGSLVATKLIEEELGQIPGVRLH